MTHLGRGILFVFAARLGSQGRARACEFGGELWAIGQPFYSRPTFRPALRPAKIMRAYQSEARLAMI
jgi:hypothetical protein